VTTVRRSTLKSYSIGAISLLRQAYDYTSTSPPSASHGWPLSRRVLSNLKMRRCSYLAFRPDLVRLVRDERIQLRTWRRHPFLRHSALLRHRHHRPQRAWIRLFCPCQSSPTPPWRCRACFLTFRMASPFSPRLIRQDTRTLRQSLMASPVCKCSISFDSRRRPSRRL